MQRLTVLLMPLVLALLPCTGNADQIPPGASQAPLYASPPIVGIWVLKLPNACTETYNYRSDGVLSVSSGEELAESSYTLDPTPGPKGFYRLVDKVLRTNGKPDCSGELTPIGAVCLPSHGDQVCRRSGADAFSILL